MNSMQFNAAGQVLMPNGSYQDGTAVAYVLAAKGVTVKAVEWLGEEYASEYAEWVNVTIGEYDETAGPLQTIDVTFGVGENTGKERYADIFVFPVSAGEVNVENITDMEEYMVGRLVQEGERQPYITPISSEEAMNEVGTYFSNLEPKGEDNLLQWDFPNAGSYHKITYTGEWSSEEASFDCAEPYAYVKLYEDTDYPMGMFSKEITENDDCWISFVSFGENMKGRFNMNSVPASATHTAAVFYDSDDNMLAAVLVEFNPAFSGDDGELAYKIASGKGELTVMDKESELYMAINGNYNVTEVYQIITNDRMLYVTGKEEFYNAFAIDPATFNDYAGNIDVEGAAPNFYVYTSACIGRDEMIVVLQVLGADGESLVNHAAFHIIFDPDADIDAEPPFAFVYPEYAAGMATLEKHTGEYADMVIADWGESQAPKDIYLLTYTDPSASSVAVLKVPGQPMAGGAFNNYDPNTGNFIDGYWLTHEMDGSNQMYVFMTEAGKADYFIFTDVTGLPTCALVCTMVLPE